MEQSASPVTTLDPRKEALQRDLAGAVRRNDVVAMYLKAGVCPKYLSQRYGIDLERCERYVAALNFQKERKREREVAKIGDSEVFEVR